MLAFHNIFIVVFIISATHTRGNVYEFTIIEFSVPTFTPLFVHKQAG